MTKSAVGLASDLCRTYVGPLAVVFLAVFALGAPAQAGAWEEFERRCLVPMENVQEPVTEGLVVVETAGNGDRSLTTFGGASLSKNDFFTVGIDSVLSILTCGIVLNGRSDLPEALSANLSDWKGDAIGEDRYSELQKTGHHTFELLRSTQWREPKIELEFYSFGPSLFLTVRETDLES